MKVFVTGGTGYIGTELIAHLLNTGHEVVGLCHKTQPALSHPSLTWMQGSLLDEAVLTSAMQGCRQVYHTAALARMWHPDKNAFFEMNVTATEKVLAAAERAGVDRLLFTSSASDISYSIKTPVSEDDPLIEPLDDDYSVTKFLAEQKVKEAALRGLHTVIVNPPRVYGPSRTAAWQNPVNKLVLAYLRRSFYMVPGNGCFQANYAFMEDLVQGHVLAMEKGRSGQRYILGGENHDYCSFFHTLERLTGIHRKRIGVPKWVMNGMAGSSSLITSITGKAPFVTAAMVGKLFSNRMLCCQKAQHELEYKITPLEQGLEKTLAFIRQNIKQ